MKAKVYKQIATTHLAAAFVALAAAQSAWADEVVDLNNETISANTTSFSAYKGKIIQNGTVNLSGLPADCTPGKYTIGSGATVNFAAKSYFNDDWDWNIVDGGVMNQTLTSEGRVFLPLYRGNCKFTLDNGTFTSLDPGGNDNYGETLNFGMFWGDGTAVAGKNISVAAAIKNGSTISLPNGALRISGGRKGGTKKANTVKVDFAVTNSTISVARAIMIGSDLATGNWISDTANSYVHVVFGPGSDLRCNQIYCYKSFVPEVTFDGATIRRAGDGSTVNFIGQNIALFGDVYTIGAGGLTIDVPSGSFATGDNTSALKGVGGITKIGAGSIGVSNIVSSSTAKAMTFTGPLVVSNGTWSSSLSYAATAFAVDGANSTLALSGDLTASAPDMSATQGGTLNLQSSDARTFTLGTLTLGESAVLSLTGGSAGVDSITAAGVVLSATTANKVAIDFSSPEMLASGEHALITITGEGGFASGDAAKFALDANAPSGSALSISANGKSLVLTVPAATAYEWSGLGDGSTFSNPNNWSPVGVPAVTSDVTIGVDAETTLDCDIALSVKSIAFKDTSAKVTITGAGCITNATAIVNSSASRHVIGVPVVFFMEGSTAAIDVTGEVDFQGGVKGTMPANHSTFYGNYTLTATSWTLSSAITLAANATVTASEMTLTLDGDQLLNADAGSRFSLTNVSYTRDGDLFGDYLGELQVGTLNIMRNATKGVNVNSAFGGILRVDAVRAFVRSDSSTWNIGGVAVIGNTGFRSAGGGFYFGSAGANLVLHSSSNWSIENDYNNSPHNGYYNKGFKINASSLDVDTSDYDTPSVGRTVTIKRGSTKDNQEATTLLDGDNGASAVSAFGIGTFVFNNTCYFTGGFTASNSVTVAVKKDANPGRGNVTFMDTATFDLVDSGSGTVPVTGTLTMAAGTTIRIPTLAAIQPLSVNALAFDGVTPESKVALNIESGTLAAGYYPIIGSTIALPEGANGNFALSLGEDVVLPENTECSLCVEGNVIYLLVGNGQGLRPGVWSGKGGDNDLSNPANWENITVPSAGDALDFSGVTSAMTVNGDIDATFGAVTMGGNVITFTGSLTATSFSDTSKIAVGKDSRVILDGSLAFSGSGDKFITYKVDAGGAFVVTGTITASESASVKPYSQESSGYIVAKGLNNASAAGNWNFRLNNDNPGYWVIGIDGIYGDNAGFWSYNDNNNRSMTTIKADADFVINSWLSTGTSKGKGMTIDTTGWNDPTTNYTIAVKKCIIGVKPLYIIGGGTLVCDYTPQNANGQNYPYSGTVTVKDTATLAINAGKKPTTGEIVVDGGATLQVAESGMVALGGDLTLKAGAALGFNYTTRNEPVLDLTGKTVTFGEGATTNVVVKISTTNGKRAKSGANVLTSGGKFAGVSSESISLAPDAPDWAMGVSVVNGDIVLDVKPMPTLIIVR